MCIQRSAIYSSVCIALYSANVRLDAASMVLLEKLNKIESSIIEHGTTLQKLQDTANSFLGPLLADKATALEQTYISPTQANMDGNIASMVFQVPKGGFASLNYFMTLPFIESLLPQGQTLQTFVCDNPYERMEHKRLPNLLSISKTLSYLVSITPFFNLAPISCFFYG